MCWHRWPVLAILGAVPVDADTVASALVSTWEHLVIALPHGWVRRESGLMAGVTGVAVPTLNGVWSERLAPDEGLVEASLDEIAGLGLPYCLQLRPGAPERLTALAEQRGMVKEEPIPLMALEGTRGPEAAGVVTPLRIRQLAPDEAFLHASIAARGFETSEEPFAQLMTPEMLRRPGARCYVGMIGDDVVTTGVGVTLGDFVGIFNVATPPEHRHHGFGAAVAARAASDGFASGARWAYLQSSRAGHGIYVRLGYVDLERWDCWVAPAAGG